MASDTYGAPGSVERAAEMFALDPATCMALLRTQPVGRLVIMGIDARVTPINFVVRDERVIVFCTDVGSRADLADGEPVLFEVDMFDARTESGWSVVVRGVMARGVDAPPPGARTWAPGPHDQWMCLSIDEVSGRLLRGAVDTDARPPGGYL